MSNWFLYLIRFGGGELYTGITTDVARRLDEHRAGGRKGAKCLRGKGPLELVFQQEIGARSAALKAERRVKRLPKAAKEQLVAGLLPLARWLDAPPTASDEAL